MGPKKLVAHKRKHPRSDSDPSLFRSPDYATLFVENFSKRNVLGGRIVDINAFSAKGLPFKEWFDKQGWTSFFTIREFTFPRLVQLFYTHLESTPIGLRSFVKGVDIDLTFDTLASILHCPNEGLRLYDSGKWSPPDVFPLNKATAMLTDDASHLQMRHSNLSKPAPSDFCALFRLLHNIISFILVPKGGHRSESSFPEVVFLWALGSGTRLNLPFIIKQHMLHTAGYKKAQLPYGMILTRIFRHFHVDFSDEEREDINPNFAFFNAKTLQRMDIVRLSDGKWGYKNEPLAQSSDDEETPAHTPVPPRHHGESSSSSRSIDDLHQEMVERFATLEANQAARHQELLKRQEEMYQYIKSFFIHPPPPPL